ncbi:MAG: hemolysin family protein [Steroidobacteraceae bacterium]|nr:hemolysin family protein [Steroidobacteraceae bacterium]
MGTVRHGDRPEDSLLVLELTLVLALVLVNAFFAMSELAIVSARRARLQNLADQGSRGARTALALADDPNRFLSTVQIGITLVGILAGTFSGATLAGRLAAWALERGAPQAWAEPVAVTLVVLLVTYLSLVVGELVPKRVAMVHADAIAVRVAPVINLLSLATRPAVHLLRASTQLLLRVLGVREESRSPVTDDEVRALLAEGVEQGSIQPAERTMVEEVLQLADRPVRTVMTQRRDVAWIDVHASREEVLERLRDHGHSRVPICAGSLDEPLGYVRIRELASALAGPGEFSLQPLVREPLMIGETLGALELMRRFRRSRPHIAFVVDEYGGFLGLVTPTDLLETIAGELREGADDDPPPVFRREDGSYLVDAQVELQELERELQTGGLSGDDAFTTLAGLVLERLGRMPKTGDVLEAGRWRIEVVDLDRHRIDKVLMTRLPEEADDLTG